MEVASDPRLTAAQRAHAHHEASRDHPHPDPEPLHVAGHEAALDVAEALADPHEPDQEDQHAEDDQPVLHTPPYTTGFSSVYWRYASTPCSLPKPDCLVPPNGSSSCAICRALTQV